MRKQWILLVGIGKYSDPQIADLPGVPIDTDLLRMCLEEFHAFPLGGRIEDLRDAAANHTNILSAFERMCDQAGAEDQILVFLAGHGGVIADALASSQLTDQTTYFLAADAHISTLPDRCIRSEDIATRLRNTRAQQVMLIFDFCSASGLTFDLPSLTSAQLESRDWFVGATCRSCQSVADTDQGGFFVRHFCHALSGHVQQQRPRISVDVRTAFEYAADRASASLARLGFPQQPRPAQAGRAILLTTPPRPLVQHTWRNVLLLEDEESYGRPVQRLLGASGYAVNWLQSVDELSIETLMEFPPDLAIVDLRLGTEAKGLSAVHALRRANPLLPILVVTAHFSGEFIFRAGKAGADDFFEKKLPGESDEFGRGLFAKIDALQRRQRESDIPDLERRLRRIDIGTLYTTILGPLYEKRGFVELRQQDVRTRSGHSLRVLCCLKDNGLGEYEGYSVYAILDDVNVYPDGSRPALDVAAVIEQLEDICGGTFVDVPPQGRSPLYRVILHCAGTVSPGARDRIESAPSLHHRVVVSGNAELIGMLRKEELEHRVTFTLPLKDVHLYLLTKPPVPSPTCTWMDVFRSQLQVIERDHQFNSQRCLEQILKNESIACGAGPSAIGDCHIYEPRLSVNLLFITLASDALPWSPACRDAGTRGSVSSSCVRRKPACGDVKLAFLSIIAGDAAQEHAIQLRRIMREHIRDYYTYPRHLQDDAQTTLKDIEERVRQKLGSEGFTAHVFRNCTAQDPHHLERLP